MKKLKKSELRVQKRYWITPSINKRLGKHSKSRGMAESQIVEDALNRTLPE